MTCIFLFNQQKLVMFEVPTAGPFFLSYIVIIYLHQLDAFFFLPAFLLMLIKIQFLQSKNQDYMT